MLSFLHRHKEPQKLCFSTDVHCHIVPGVDDGAPDAATAAELAERMAGWGINRVIATPHVRQDHFENTPDILDPALEELTEEIARRNIPIEVTRSAEYRIDDFFKKQIEAGIITPFPNGFILVENPFTNEPWDIDGFLFELKKKRLRPILAHPERYAYYEHNPHRYGQFYRSGTFLQINLLSLAGYYGREEKRTAEMLLEKGYIDFIGTDLHNHRMADAIEEYLTTKHYRNIASKLKLLNDKSFN